MHMHIYESCFLKAQLISRLAMLSAHACSLMRADIVRLLSTPRERQGSPRAQWLQNWQLASDDNLAEAQKLAEAAALRCTDGGPGGDDGAPPPLATLPNVRLYLATRCSLSPSAYVAWSLPGYTLQFDLDLDGAGCGCNVAPYLVSMAQNNQPGSCSGDHYCECGDETQTRASSALDGRATQRACSLSLRRCSLQPALITARATWTLTAAQRERGVRRALCGNRRGRGQHARLPRDCAHVQ